MARALWKASLVIGSKRVPVSFVAAVKDHGVRLHLLHGADGVRVKQRLVDPTNGRTVEQADTKRGYEIEPGRFVVLDGDELRALEPEPSRDIEVTSFVPRGAIDHRWYERPYYLAAESGHEHEYAALAAAMAETEHDGFARWSMRKREHAGALVLHEGYLALVSLRHAQEVIVASDLDAPEGREPDQRELQLASQLVGALAGPFEHGEFRDEYRGRLLELVEQKRKGKKIRLVRHRSKPAGDESLVEILEKSIGKAG